MCRHYFLAPFWFRDPPPPLLSFDDPARKAAMSKLPIGFCAPCWPPMRLFMGLLFWLSSHSFFISGSTVGRCVSAAYMTGSLFGRSQAATLTVVNQVRHAEEYTHTDETQQDHRVLENAQDIDW